MTVRSAIASVLCLLVGGPGGATTVGEPSSVSSHREGTATEIVAAPRMELLQSREAFVVPPALSWNPPAASAADLGIAVGPSSVLETSNYAIALVAKNGEVIARSELPNFFRPVQSQTGSAFDVDSIYDRLSRRFFIAAVANGPGGKRFCGETCWSYEYVAVSRSANPQSFTADDWYLYELPVTPSRGEPITYWSDGTRLTATKKFLAFHSEQYRFDEHHSEVTDKIRVLDKKRLVKGKAARWAEFRDIEDLFNGDLAGYVLPQQVSPSKTLFAVQTECGTTEAYIMVIGISGSWRRPKLITRTITTEGNSGCGGPIASPQPGDGPALQNYGGGKAIYREGSIWLVHTTARRLDREDVSGIRVVEIDVSNWPRGISIKHDLTLAAAKDWNGFPAVAVDGNGNVLVVHSSTSRTQFPSVEYTWSIAKEKRALHPSKVLKAGAISLVGGNYVAWGDFVRFADYFAATVDPVDDSMWFIGQYAGDPSRPTVWVGQVIFQ